MLTMFLSQDVKLATVRDSDSYFTFFVLFLWIECLDFFLNFARVFR